MRALTVLPKFPSPPPLALLVTFLFYTSIFNGHLAVFAIYVCMYIYLFTSTHFQCSCLGNPMVKGAWQAIVHGITRIRHNLMTETAKSQQLIYLYFWHHGSCCWAWATPVAARGLSSCGTWAQLPVACEISLDQGSNSMAPALVGRFLTSGPAGKSCMHMHL